MAIPTSTYGINPTSNGTTNGENHLLTSIIQGILVAYGRYARGRRFSRKRPTRTSSISHVPSTMDQSFATNVSAVVFAVTPSVNAGGSITSNRLDTDRDRDVSNGEKIGSITYSLTFEPASAGAGSIEWCCFRTERSQSTPALGTILPTSAENASQGLQQAMRLNIPGWVMKFGVFPVSAETPMTRTIVVRPSRMGAPPIRDGDFMGIVMHNRTNGTINFSVQMRYKSFR